MRAVTSQNVIYIDMGNKKGLPLQIIEMVLTSFLMPAKIHKIVQTQSIVCSIIGRLEISL